MKRAILIFTLTVIWFALFAPLGVDFHHDGVMLIPALRIAAGGAVFRDAFCQYGWLTPVLQSFAALISGGELLALKLLSVLFYGGTAVLLDLVWKERLSKNSRLSLLFCFWLLMPDMMVTFHPWSSIFALFFTLSGVLFFLKYLQHAKKTMLFCAGCAAGCAFLSRHPCGVVTAAALAAVIGFETLFVTEKDKWKTFFRKISIFAGGFLSPVAVMALCLTVTGAWSDYFRQCFGFISEFVWKRGTSGSWEHFSNSLFPFYSDGSYFLDMIFALLPLCTLGWLFALFRNSSAKSAEDWKKSLPLLVLVLTALGSWHQYYPVPCVRHLYWGGVPMLGFFILTLEKLVNSKRSLLTVAVIFVLSLSFVAAASSRLYGAYVRLSTARFRTISDIPGIRGMALTRMEKELINHFRSAFNSLPENLRKRGVVNYSEDALWSVIFPDSGFKHKQFLRTMQTLYPDYEREIFNFIAEKQPVIFTDSDRFFPGYTDLVMPVEYQGKIYRLIARNDGSRVVAAALFGQPHFFVRPV